MYERDVFLVSIANQITLEDLPTIIALVALQAAVDSNLNIIQDDIGNEEEKASPWIRCGITTASSLLPLPSPSLGRSFPT